MHSLPFQFVEDDWATVWDGLRNLNWRAAIVGPEGHGKTTLLEEILERLPQQFPERSSHNLSIVRYVIQSGQRRLAREQAIRISRLTARDFIFLDGAEQLSPRPWKSLCKASRHASGIVITSHREGLLPTLLTCHSDLALLRKLVAQLMPDWQTLLNETELESLFEHYQGNIRHCFQSLYDRLAGRHSSTLQSRAAGERQPGNE